MAKEYLVIFGILAFHIVFFFIHLRSFNKGTLLNVLLMKKLDNVARGE